MRPVLLTTLALVAIALPAAAVGASDPAASAQNLCTHGRPSALCPSLRAGPGLASAMRHREYTREERALRAALTTALEEGRCEAARRMAVDKGRHDLAARIRRACATRS